MMSGLSTTRNRPVLSRGETIDSCCSEDLDLVTVLEVQSKIPVEKRPFKVTDRLRLFRKGMMASSLKELVQNARDKFCIDPWMEVYLVLEEDGTEVDDEEYFQTLEKNTMLMLLLKEDIWSPEGPPYMVREITFDEIQV